MDASLDGPLLYHTISGLEGISNNELTLKPHHGINRDRMDVMGSSSTMLSLQRPRSKAQKLLGNLQAWFIRSRPPASIVNPFASRPTKLAPLLEFPAEIIFLILELLTFSEVLSFALSSYLCYTLALPILKRSVTITQHSEPAFRQLALSNNPHAGLVHHVKLGRLDKPGAAEHWNFTGILRPILTSFPYLDTLSMCGGTYVKGWAGLDEIGRALGDKLKRLQMRLEPPYPTEGEEEEEMPPALFTVLTSIDILVVGMGATSSQVKSIPSQLSQRLPNLAHLELSFHSSAYDKVAWTSIEQRCTFFSNNPTRFPHLRSFHLGKLPRKTSLQLGPLEFQGLLKFLNVHQETLQHLTLPQFLSPAVFDPATPTTQLALTKLQSGMAMVMNLAPQGVASPTLQELTLLLDYGKGDDDPFRDASQAVYVAAAQWPYPSVRELMLVRPGSEINYTTILLFCPQLEQLHLDFHDNAVSYRSWERQKNSFIAAASQLREIVVKYERTTNRYRVKRKGGKTSAILEETKVETVRLSYWSY